MKRCYVRKRFRAEALARIAMCNEIIEEYQEQKLKMTLRQLYYQCVAHRGLPNSDKSYKALAALVSDARIAGLIDWDAIEDRGRMPKSYRHWTGPKSFIGDMCWYYRKDRWAEQTQYIELWVEKDALAGVLTPLADEFDVTLVVNKGYSSSSAMHAAAQRYIEHVSREWIIFYLGDHDPSGEDMVRDIRERLAMFEADVRVEKLALTMEQVLEHKPPPNPAKTSDSRYDAYAQLHGDESWEVDALGPAKLAAIIRAAFVRTIDVDAMEAAKKLETAERDALRKAAAKIKVTT